MYQIANFERLDERNTAWSCLKITIPNFTRSQGWFLKIYLCIIYSFSFSCVFFLLFCCVCNERSITLYIPILCFSINRNESLLFLCVFLSNRGGDTSIFLNISETGDTMGKIWCHGGKNCRKWPKKPNKYTNGQQNRCLHPCHTCQL